MDLRDLRCYLEESAGFYRLLGSALLRELTDEQIEALARAFAPDAGADTGAGADAAGAQAAGDLRADAAGAGAAGDEGAQAAGDAAVASLGRYLARRGPNARQDLAVEYARVFLAAGVYEGDTAVPYESVYTSDEGILMQDARDDAVRRYLAHGFAVDPDLNVPEDHLGFEFEFMALLADEACARMDAGEPWEPAAREQRAFACDHLLNWMPALIDRVDAWAELPFYPALLRLALAYVETTRDVVDEALRA